MSKASDYGFLPVVLVNRDDDHTEIEGFVHSRYHPDIVRHGQRLFVRSWKPSDTVPHYVETFAPPVFSEDDLDQLPPMDTTLMGRNDPEFIKANREGGTMQPTVIDGPTCGQCGKAMTPQNARVHPELFLCDDCINGPTQTLGGPINPHIAPDGPTPADPHRRPGTMNPNILNPPDWRDQPAPDLHERYSGTPPPDKWLD